MYTPEQRPTSDVGRHEAHARSSIRMVVRMRQTGERESSTTKDQETDAAFYRRRLVEALEVIIGRDRQQIKNTHRASRSLSRRARMSFSRTGPFTLRMMERLGSSMNSTRTCVTPPREPVRPRTYFAVNGRV